MRIEPRVSGVAIVFVGNFNPAILTPAWFAMHELLPRKVADSADLQMAHPQMTVFTADWLHLVAGAEQFTIQTSMSPYVRLRDLALRLFGEHLSHTPLTALGINRTVHFRVRDMGARDQLWRILAPIAPWGDWGRVLESGDDSRSMSSLTMTQPNPPGRPVGGSINVKVEPSHHMGDGRTGVYVQVNDHFAPGGDGPGSARRIVELLKDNFDSSISHSEGIIDHVMSLTSTTVD